jgi:hypothetical protein
MIVPDAIEPIVGWRYWNLNYAWRLESLINGRDTPWRPGVRKEANCCDELLSALRASLPPETVAELELKPEDADLFREHVAPHESCSCGIYAAKDLDTLRTVSGPGLIVGEVYLWGKVIPGELGYRAQYAYPKSLRLVSKGVPDDVLESLKAYCDDVGLITPKEAWGSWGRRALCWGLMLGRVMVNTPLGAIVIILAVAAYRAFIA